MTNPVQVENSRPWHNEEHGVKLAPVSKNISATISISPIPLIFSPGRHIRAEKLNESTPIIQQPILPFTQDFVLTKDLQAEFDAWETISDEALIDFEQELK